MCLSRYLEQVRKNRTDRCFTLSKALDNEIDVIGIKNSRPYLISCKMRRVNPSDVNEIYCMAKKIGGTTARPIIATTEDIRKTQECENGIYHRLKKLGVGYIEARKPGESIDEKGMHL